jgi:hypothetical protein
MTHLIRYAKGDQDVAGTLPSLMQRHHKDMASSLFGTHEVRFGIMCLKQRDMNCFWRRSIGVYLQMPSHCQRLIPTDS